VNSSSTAKTILFWISIVFLGVMLWRLVSANTQTPREDTPSYSEFMARVDEGDVKEVTMYLSPNSYEVQGEYAKQNKKFRVTVPKENAPEITKALRDKSVQLSVKEVRSSDWVLILLNALPLLLLAGFVFFLMRQMQAGGNKALSFGKSRARLLSAQQKKSHLQGCGGQRRSQRRTAGNHRVLEGPAKVSEARRTHPQGCTARGASRNGQNPFGACDRRRS